MIFPPPDHCLALPGARGTPDTVSSPDPFTVEELLDHGLILAEDWQALPPAARAEVCQCADLGSRLALLLRHGLLTDYQVSRLRSGNPSGLILGNYRVLDRLGSGGMGVVFRAEHVRLRRRVAIKVLHPVHAENPQLVQRFHREVRAVAQLQHPNVVAAFDVGEVPSSDLHTATVHYFVMEDVPGLDLEQLVKLQGPLPVTKACDVIFQIASALGEADKHHLVHRDIKPSNIQVTPTGQAKLLDFGLARLVSHQGLTAPGVPMGTFCYMAPEQIDDASAVDIRADIYALGGTLLWGLTGQPPFSSPPADAFPGRGHRPTPAALEGDRADIPSGLRAVLKRMTAPKPEDRYQTPQEVMGALLPFLKQDLRDDVRHHEGLPEQLPAAPGVGPSGARVHQVLIADDEPDVRQLCHAVLQSATTQCDGAADGVFALEALQARRYDLLLLDLDMPRMNGRELLRRLRETPPYPHLKVILFSGRSSGDNMAELLLAGADDYLSKPFSVVQLQARVKAALRFKDLQDRSDLLNQQLLASNRKLEQGLNARDASLVHLRNSLILSLAKLVEYRDSETGQHLVRMQRYCQVLAEEAAKSSPFGQQIDAHFIEMLVACVPLHDIGKAIVPDHILLKPGKLDPTERIIVQRHTVIGRETLAGITMQHGLTPAFLQMASDIATHHHERYDGQGYPDQLAGTDIPLAARIVAIADVYDALRSRRVYKPSLSHATAVEVIVKASEGQFDPALLAAFIRCADQFDRIFRDHPD
jgi:response regulator RpfG family c-di-GMP phosphodiesterase